MKLESQSIEMFGLDQTGQYPQRKWGWTKIENIFLHAIATLRKNMLTTMLHSAPILLVLLFGYMGVVSVINSFITALVLVLIISATRFVWAILAMDFRFERDFEAEDEMR